MIQDCTCCFQDYLVKCNETIRVNTLLESGQPLVWVITDKFGSQYEGNAVTNADGYVDIPVEDLPAGLLTTYSGQFKLEFYQNGECTPMKFKMAQEYSCIDFTIISGTREKNNLGCPVTG